MRNPFKQQLPLYAYSNVPSKQGDSADVEVHANTVELDDANLPDVTIGPMRGNIAPTVQDSWPGYAGQEHMAISHQQSMQHTQVFAGQFALPDPTVGSIPGSEDLATLYGPVTGADNAYTNTRQATSATPPGSYGPVVGGTDYSQLVTQANLQQALAAYSPAVSDQAMIAAI